MTDHPITPPPELVQQWMNEICDDPNGNPQFVSSDDRALAARAAQWGADQELEAYWQWADEAAWPGAGDELRMTDHPITSPPPELVQQWMNEARHQDYCNVSEHVATRAAAWGADTELEACCEWLQDPDLNVDTYKLRSARRPKPPSLKEQALQELDKVDMLWATEEFGQETLNSLETIRKALEALPDD